MQELTAVVLSSLNSALSKMSGYRRRQYAAELAQTYFEGSARKAERHLKVSRKTVTLGLHELRSGIRCLENFQNRGRKKKKIC